VGIPPLPEKSLSWIKGILTRAIFDVSGRSIITSGDKGLKQWPVEPRRDGNASLKIGPGKMFRKLVGTRICLHGSKVASRFRLSNTSECNRFKMKEKMEEILLPQSIGFDFAALSPDGRMLAAAAETNDLVRIWANPNAQIVKDLRARLTSVASASAPDSKLLVTALNRQIYLLGNLPPGDRTDPYPRQRAHIVKCGICFTQDGRMAAIPRSLGRSYSPH